MNTRNMKARLAVSGLAASVALAGCGGGGSDSTTPAATAAGNGTLQVSLTDAPACGFDQVNVTVDRVRAHQNMMAGDGDAGWKEIILAQPKKIDLLSLQNGVLVDLGQTTLPAGQYTQMRLVLVSNTTKALSNTVKPTGGTEMEMDTPSAMQSGLKLINGFTVEAGKTTSIVLDFDACKSVVQRGNGSYGLKPVIQMMGMTATSIAGYVQSGLTNVTVTAQKDGVVLKATQPDSNGRFVLSPLDPTKGPYNVVFTGPALATSVIAGVPVVPEQPTFIGSDINRVAIPSSQSGTVTGNVGPVAARDTGLVRALQAVGTVPVVEVAHVNVVQATGDYSLQLPVEAPRLLAYSNPLVWPLNFQAQSASAGKYKLEASASGFTKQTGSEITVTSGSVLGNQNFTLAP